MALTKCEKEEITATLFAGWHCNLASDIDWCGWISYIPCGPRSQILTGMGRWPSVTISVVNRLLYAVQVIEEIPHFFQPMRPAHEDVINVPEPEIGLRNALLSTLSMKSFVKKLAATDGSGNSVANLLVFLRIGC